MWFDKIKKVNFLAEEIKRQISLRSVKKFDAKTVATMITLYNIHNSLRRLTTVIGTSDNHHIVGEVSEKLDVNGSFYKKLMSTWNIVQEGNKSFKDKFSKLPSSSKNVVLSNVLMDYYVPAVSAGNEPFELMFQLESITIPLDVVGLENDETLLITTDFDVKGIQEFNVDGAFDKKIVGKIEMKNVQDLENKKTKNFSQTFSMNEGKTHEGFLQSMPITITSMHDLKKL